MSISSTMLFGTCPVLPWKFLARHQFFESSRISINSPRRTDNSLEFCPTRSFFTAQILGEEKNFFRWIRFRLTSLQLVFVRWPMNVRSDNFDYKFPTELRAPIDRLLTYHFVRRPVTLVGRCSAKIEGKSFETQSIRFNSILLEQKNWVVPANVDR